MSDETKTLKICQLNANKSNTAQSAFLHTIADYDVVALQEPHIDFLKNTRASQNWIVIYPTGHKDSDATSRSLTLINKRISTNSWTAIPIPSPDITAFTLRTPTTLLHLFNVYNPQDSDLVQAHLARETRRLLRDDEEEEAQVVWLGDFNRHHPLWDDERNMHLFTDQNLNRAEELIRLLSAFDLHMLLPEGIPTLEASNTKNLTRPDNVFATKGLADSLLVCKTDLDLRPPCTDHFPVVTTLQLDVPLSTPKTFRNFRKVEWAEFRTKLVIRLENLPDVEKGIHTKESFNSTLDALMDALTDTIKETVPETKPPPFAKRWFSKELNTMRREVGRLGRRAWKLREFPDHPIHHEYRSLRNRYGDQIRSAKRAHWDAWLEEADTRSIWTVGKYIRAGSSDGSKSRIPPLRRPNSTTLERDNTAKSEILYETFFPQPPPDIDQPDAEPFPPNAFEFAHVTDEQIADACHRLKEFKAAGPDGIPNEVYKRCADLLIPYLGPLFRATFDLHHYPDQWKQSITVVLRKPGRSDYSVAKSYRPIALMNCMGKILSSCVTETVEFELEKLGLFPKHHFGGRAGRTTTDSLHLLTKTVYDAWRTKKVVSILFLDVEAAFPSAIPERLFHEMRKLGIPETVVGWLRRKLQGRQTRLSFDDFISELFEILSGIDQGCPLSVLLYKIYNLMLLECADEQNGEMALGFIDDVAALAIGRNLESTTRTLKRYMERRGGAKHWSRTRNSRFETSKLNLVHADPSLSAADMGPPLVLADGTVQPSEAAKFLGVWVDRKLTFKRQAEYALKKGTTWLMQFGRLARPKGGLSLCHVRTLYQQMLLPGMLYAASVWITPQRKVEGRQRLYGSVGVIRKLARIHRQACIMMTGAMRTTATDVMEAHLNLLPFHLLVDKMIMREASRLCTLPTTHPLHPHVKKAAAGVERHRSPLHEILTAYDLRPTEIEKIEAVRLPPGWRPPYTVSIAENKEAALEEERKWEYKPGPHVYTDGSDVDGGVGAAAVLTRPGRETKVLRYRLGSAKEHTVYEAEIVGLILGVILIARELSARVASCAADNTACLQASRNRKPHPGHYLIDKLLRDVDRLQRRHPGIRFTLRWVPGHKGVEGNEMADEEAKKAARGDESEAALLPSWLRAGLPISLSKVRQTFNEVLAERAKEEWRASPRAERMDRINPDLPSKGYCKLTEQLPRRHASILFQLRTEHAPLQRHLHRIQRADSPSCPNCNMAQETVYHFLMECPAYDDHRARLALDAGPAARSIRHLLTTPKLMGALFRYIHATGRFTTTYGSLSLRDERS
ncbi:hypothetical protein EVJ58_g9980 [Rhodofomes roseus]|uniref:Reverse transcriptase (RNA-dependent DNA polymerase) n=1 Tax=Rhodofomes roseus TaxID=34475 RepID=A0A4Y9XQC2_9APHY|nr:hypothetical protein EVJ58_g9980 [Rhodofomes roseus]